MSEAIYRLAGIGKRYASFEACRVDYLEIPPGAITVVMGPNGAGKSTLLRLMGFLEPPSEGTLDFLGHRCFNGRQPPLALRREVSMVFQLPILFSGSVEMNVTYGLKVRGEGNARARMLQALESVGLLHKARARVSTLSAGEAQRVALARALVLEPRVLLLDEPTSNLDPANVALVEKLLVQAVEDRRATVVLVTQDVFQAKRLAHHVAFMLDGRLVETGSGDRVLSDASDPRTRAFVRGELLY